MQLKKYIQLFVAFSLILSSLVFFSPVANAVDVISTGKCGPTVTYEIYSDRSMVLKGSGTVRQSNFSKDISSLTVSEGIKSISNYVFSECDALKDVSLPKSLETIGEMAFYSSGIESVNIPRNVNSIGSLAFADCIYLKNIEVDRENSFFSSSSGVLLDKEKTKLIAFPEGKGNSYNVPDGITEICSGAFYMCENLKSVSLPKSLEIIGDESFSKSGISKIEIGKNVSFIGNKSFENCTSLEDVILECKSGKIGDFAFYYCKSLKNVYIGEGITEIGSFAFYDCDGMVRIRVPESVSYIGERAFSDSNNLRHVIVCGKNVNICEKAIGFDGANRLRDTTVYSVLGSTIEKYCDKTFKFVDASSTSPIFTDNLFAKEKYLYGVKENTEVYEIFSLIGNKDVNVKKTSINDIVGTGTKISLSSQISFFVIVKGDVDGDGNIGILDCEQVKKTFGKSLTLEDAYFVAADTDGDTILTSTDYLRIKAKNMSVYIL